MKPFCCKIPVITVLYCSSYLALSKSAQLAVPSVQQIFGDLGHNGFIAA